MIVKSDHELYLSFIFFLSRYRQNPWHCSISSAVESFDRSWKQSQYSLGRLLHFVVRILGPEKNFYYLAIIYGIGISILSLATPVSVQMLINTVANTALTVPLAVLSLTLFGLLLVAVLLNALRIHLMDLFARRFYACMVSEIALRSIYAQNPFFDEQGRGTLFNRYFDIVVVHKSLPYILIGGLAVVLQTVIGFLLVSLYHPLFLVFNLAVAATVWLLWMIWGPRAIRSAVQVSHEKHATAAWLEGLGESNGFFKSEQRIARALARTGIMRIRAHHVSDESVAAV